MRFQTTSFTHFFQRMILLAACVFAGITGSTSANAATKPSLTASLSPTQIAAGDAAIYTITIKGGSPDEDVRPSFPASVEIAGGPAVGTQVTVINGVQSSSVTLTWQITSTEPGEHVIPAQEFHVGGVPYRSNETRLMVKDASAAGAAPAAKANDPLLTIEVEKRQIYVGEVIPVTVNLYLTRRTMLRRIGLIELPKDSFAVQRFPLQAEENNILLGGQPYRTMAFHSTLSALKPGKFKVGPATMEIIVEVPVGNDSGLHPFLAQPTATRKLKPQCNSVDITVLPLPTEGRPKNFNGVIGDFELSVSAEPHDLAVGDPVATELTIGGTGNFDTLTVPALTDATDWKVYPARRFNLDGSNSANVPTLDGNQLAMQHIGFTQVIIPKKRLAAIPPFEFSYFSPTKKQYFTLRTNPVPLNMREPERPAETAPRIATGNSSTNLPDEGPEKVSSPKARMTDIITVTPTEAHWLAANIGLWNEEKFLTSNVLLASALGLLALMKIAGLAFAAWHTKSNTPHSALWREMKQDSLPRARFYQLAATLIQSSSADRNALPEPLAAIMAQHEALNFSHHQDEANAAITREERARVLHALKPLA